MTRPKDIGTAAETAVVRFLRDHGWPWAERRALTGSQDQGDVTGCPGLVFEVKGGKAAKTASDGQVEAWLAETETERRNADADLGILVMARAGIGPTRAGLWWAVLTVPPFTGPVRMHLQTAAAYLHHLGYGDAGTDQTDVADDGRDDDPWAAGGYVVPIYPDALPDVFAINTTESGATNLTTAGAAANAESLRLMDRDFPADPPQPVKVPCPREPECPLVGAHTHLDYP